MQETEHDVRFSGAAYGSSVRAACDPCEWHAYVKTGDGRGFIVDDFRVIEQGHMSGRWVKGGPGRNVRQPLILEGENIR